MLVKRLLIIHTAILALAGASPGSDDCKITLHSVAWQTEGQPRSDRVLTLAVMARNCVDIDAVELLFSPDETDPSIQGFDYEFGNTSTVALVSDSTGVCEKDVSKKIVAVFQPDTSGGTVSKSGFHVSVRACRNRSSGQMQSCDSLSVEISPPFGEAEKVEWKAR